MKYEYNPKIEAFERKINGYPKGRKLWVNIDEARRIVTMHELGNTVGQIQSKIRFNNPKASGNTIKTIVELYDTQQIELGGDFPAPSLVFDDLSVEARINDLESRLKLIENILSELKSDCFCTCMATTTEELSIMDKVKSWLKV